ncbi:hypothetical protein NW768_001263 [Fusarium equiseti]|uniref:Uncharacterized protein n=1 Tax=Fusarium equiseti TaxID=61235 RepID=A0ABQ8RQB4_FUSEQ|nr:hypothetical protein NW768_001263 [Fusarium equiseti]
MEGYDDTRCLPKMPKLFTTPPDTHPDLVLFSASCDTEDSTKNTTPHAIDSCNDGGKDDHHEKDGKQVHTPPSNAPHSTLMSPGDGKYISSYSDEDCQKEITKDLEDRSEKGHKLEHDTVDGNSDASGETTPNGHPIETGTASPGTEDQAPQPLTKNRLRSIPDARLYKLGSVYKRLKEMTEDSQGATASSDTPRPELDADSDGTLEDHKTTSEPEYPAYYIFDPRSNGCAYYMYQDADTQEGYKIEKVSFKPTLPEPGRRAYYIEASEKDTGEQRHDSQETLWRVDSSRIPAVVIDSDSSTSHEAVVDTNEPLYDGDEATQSIARKVSDRLQKIRHLREHLRVINGKGRDVPEAKGLYLIGDKDIRDVVSIVLGEALKNGHIDRPDRTTTTTEESSESRSLPKLDGDSNTILVSTPAAVDPATTINLPSTSYANINATDMEVHTKTRRAESDTTTTVITRRSIAEITWSRAYPEGHDPDSRTHGRTVSDCCSPTHGGSRSCPDDRRQSDQKASKGDPTLRHYTTPKSTAEILADIMCNKSFEQQLRVSDGTVITSFPRLFSRDLTTDWAGSPAEGGESNKTAPSTFYHHGIDARSGLHEPLPTPSVEHPPVLPMSSTYNKSLFDANPFNKPKGKSFSTLLASERRLSASLDADTQRRRSSQIADIEEEVTDHACSRPGLMHKIKHGGHKLFHKSHFRRPNESAATEEDAFEESNVVRSGNSTGRGGTPEPSKSNSHGAHKTLTGSKLDGPSYEEGVCSEDDKPHRCVNDLSSRDISPK